MKALFFELFMKADASATLSPTLTALASLFLVLAPFLLRVKLGDPIFENDWQMKTEAVMIFPLLV